MTCERGARGRLPALLALLFLLIKNIFSGKNKSFFGGVKYLLNVEKHEGEN